MWKERTEGEEEGNEDGGEKTAGLVGRELPVGVAEFAKREGQSSRPER